MTTKTTRILKEACPLFRPWCAMIAAGMLPLAGARDLYMVSVAVLLFGIPLLAALPLGNEFQHRTLSLLLSQPVGRMKVWGEKLSVTAVAVVTLVLLFSLALRATSFHPGRMGLAFAGAWIVAITASATFWTLFTRSTVGGIALNIVVQSILILTGALGEPGRRASRQGIPHTGKHHRGSNRRHLLLRRCNGLAGRANAGAVSGNGRHGWRRSADGRSGRDAGSVDRMAALPSLGNRSQLVPQGISLDAAGLAD